MHSDNLSQTNLPNMWLLILVYNTVILYIKKLNKKISTDKCILLQMNSFIRSIFYARMPPNSGSKLEEASHEMYKQKTILFQLMHILGAVLILSYITYGAVFKEICLKLWRLQIECDVEYVFSKWLFLCSIVT